MVVVLKRRSGKKQSLLICMLSLAALTALVSWALNKRFVLHDLMDMATDAADDDAGGGDLKDQKPDRQKPHRKEKVLLDPIDLPKRPSMTDYAHNVSKFEARSAERNVLEFVHLTKTGGTAVEQAAAKAGVTWGMCHFKAQKSWATRGCNRADWEAPYTQWASFALEQWHAPPLWLHPNPYQESPTFTIVRNPYERVLSEYYCKFFGFHRAEYFGRHQEEGVAKSFPKDRPYAGMKARRDRSPLNAGKGSSSLQRYSKLLKMRHRREAHMNRPHRRRLTSSLDGMKRASISNRREPASKGSLNQWIRKHLKVHVQTGHMLPQHYHVYDGDGVQVIDHILYFESLHQDFERLMQQYDLKIELPEERSANQGHASMVKRMTVDDINAATIELINAFYEKDFELFGYKMIER